MNRPESGTVPAKSWLQRLLADEARVARDYVRSHSHHVADVMTRKVVTADERTPLQDIAVLMQRNGIKRVPVVRDGKVIGIVSRANLLQGLLAREPYPATSLPGDDEVRTEVSRALDSYRWANGVSNVVVDSGVVSLWGHVHSPAAKEAIRVAAENVAGVRRVMNNVVVMPGPGDGGI